MSKQNLNLNFNLIVFLLVTTFLFAEIFEFDAMDELPSVLDVEVYDFDGSFDETASLGHAEINFLKYNKSDLADLWIPLQGKLAQACRSKLHLRVFLDNSRGGNVVREYLSKMEKKVGKKVHGQLYFGDPHCYLLICLFICYVILSHALGLSTSVVINLTNPFVDECAVSSDKFSLSKTLWASTRGVSH